MRSGERTYTRSEFGNVDPTSLVAGCDEYLVKLMTRVNSPAG